MATTEGTVLYPDLFEIQTLHLCSVLLFHSSCSAPSLSLSLIWCLFTGRPRAQRSFITAHAGWKKKDSLEKNEKGEKYLSCSMYYSHKLASYEFSKAQIVVNDSKLPQGFEISAVWGSFSFSNISNGFISEGPVTMQSPLWTNGWVISILNKIIANLFSSSVRGKRVTERERRRRRQRRRENDKWCQHESTMNDAEIHTT